MFVVIAHIYSTVYGLLKVARYIRVYVQAGMAECYL